MAGPVSALVVLVPEAEPLVQDLRARHDPSAADGVPAHVTVLVPFLEPAAITAADLDTLRDLFARRPAFDAAFAEVGRFPATAWLAPQPAAPFVALTQAVWARWPSHPPYGGAFAGSVPHLTVADGDAAVAARIGAEMTQRLAASGPLRVRCREVVLLDNASGRFRLRHRFRLGRALERNPGSP